MGLGGVAKAHGKHYGVSASQVYSHALRAMPRAWMPRSSDRFVRDPSVDMVVPDGFASIDETQTGATWGLDGSISANCR